MWILRLAFRYSAILTIASVLAPGGVTLQAQADPGAPPDSAARVGSISGTVVAAVTGEPLSGAVVVIAGADHNTETSSDGRFELQGVSAGELTLVVGAVGYRALSFSFRLGVGSQINIASPIALVEHAARSENSLEIIEADERGAPGFGTIAGQIVVEGTDRPLQAALVRIPGSVVTDITDDAGRFMLSGLEEGPHRVVVGRIGFEPVEIDVQMADGAQMEIATPIGLVPQTPELAELVSETTNPIPPRLMGFYERQRKGFGHFITPAYIERRHPFRTTDLLGSTPGVLVSQGGINERVVTMRSGTVSLTAVRGPVDRCIPAYFIDGIEIPIDDIDREIQVQDVQAMEIYNSATTTPPEFQRPNRSCGVIINWTR